MCTYDSISSRRTRLAWIATLGAASLCARCFTGFELPSVSVQIVTYQRPSLLLEALQQIEVQDYDGKLEVLILDDSPESSEQAVEEFAKSSRHCINYRFLSQRHTIGAKRNLGVNLSESELICTWDDDDIYPSDRIRCQVDFLLEHPRCKCAMIERRYFFWMTNVLRACHDELQLFPLENTLCFWKDWFQAGRRFDTGSVNEGLGLLRGKRGLKHPGRVGVLSIPAEALPFLYVKHKGSVTGDQIVDPLVEGLPSTPKGLATLPLTRAIRSNRFPALKACAWYTKVLTAVRKLLRENMEQDLEQLKDSDVESVAFYLRELTGHDLLETSMEGLLAQIQVIKDSLIDSET